MIVTGCQRSGTMTASFIFGIVHEHNFVPSITFEKVNELLHDQTIIAEASWLAQPFHKTIASKNIRILHLVRHPLAVINSLIGINFWAGTGHEPYRDFCFQHLPGLKEFSDPIKLSMFYWVFWNAPLEYYVRVRIEDFQQAPALNKRPRAKLTVNDLPNTMIKELLVKKADLYGYTL